MFEIFNFNHRDLMMIKKYIMIIMYVTIFVSFSIVSWLQFHVLYLG